MATDEQMDKAVELARALANMYQPGQLIEGRPFRMTGEDAIETLTRAIWNARDAVGDPFDAITRERKITVTAGELLDMMREADAALDGDSNDAEHDALYSVREALSGLVERP